MIQMDLAIENPTVMMLRMTTSQNSGLNGHNGKESHSDDIENDDILRKWHDK